MTPTIILYLVIWEDLCVLNIPRVESRNDGNALDEGVFERMEIGLTEGLSVRGIQALSLKWHKTLSRNG